MNLSKENTYKIYLNVLSNDKIPITLEPYRRFLKIICQEIEYSPSFKDIVGAIAVTVQDENMTIDYLQGELGEKWEKIKFFYETRILYFSIHSSLIEKILLYYKDKNPSISFLSSFVLGLSTNYSNKKINKIQDKTLFLVTIEALLEQIFNQNLKRNDLYQLSTLNPKLGTIFFYNYDSIDSLKESILPIHDIFPFLTQFMLYILLSGKNNGSLSIFIEEMKAEYEKNRQLDILVSNISSLLEEEKKKLFEQIYEDLEKKQSDNHAKEYKIVMQFQPDFDKMS